MRDWEESQAPQVFSFTGPSVLTPPARAGACDPPSVLSHEADGTIELLTSRGWLWSFWQLCTQMEGMQLLFYLTSHYREAGGSSCCNFTRLHHRPDPASKGDRYQEVWGMENQSILFLRILSWDVAQTPLMRSLGI